MPKPLMAEPNINPGTEPTTRDRGKIPVATVPATPQSRTQAQIAGAEMGTEPNRGGQSARRAPKSDRFTKG